MVKVLPQRELFIGKILMRFKQRAGFGYESWFYSDHARPSSARLCLNIVFCFKIARGRCARGKRRASVRRRPTDESQRHGGRHTGRCLEACCDTLDLSCPPERWPRMTKIRIRRLLNFFIEPFVKPVAMNSSNVAPVTDSCVKLWYAQHLRPSGLIDLNNPSSPHPGDCRICGHHHTGL